MKTLNEYQALFGTEGVYTHAGPHVPVSQYAALVRELRDCGINVHLTENVRAQGIMPARFRISTFTKVDY